MSARRVSNEQIEGYLDGHLSEEARASVTRELVRCEASRRALAGRYQARGPASTAQEAESFSVPDDVMQRVRSLVPETVVEADRSMASGARWALLAASVLLAVALAVVVWRPQAPPADDRDVLRSSTSAELLALESPSGDVTLTGPVEFRWGALEDVVEYQFQWVAATGDRIFAVTTESTEVTLTPEEIRALPQHDSSYWWVRARFADGTSIDAEPLALRLTIPP